MQAKDIPDAMFVDAVAICSVRQAQAWNMKTSWCNRVDVANELSKGLGVEVPHKVILAKARKLIDRGIIDGCACGCRGDFDLRGKPGDPFAAKMEGRLTSEPG